MDGGQLTSRAGAVPVGKAPAEVVERLLAGETVRADALGLDVTRALVDAGVVVAG